MRKALLSIVRRRGQTICRRDQDITAKCSLPTSKYEPSATLLFPQRPSASSADTILGYRAKLTLSPSGRTLFRQRDLARTTERIESAQPIDLIQLSTFGT